MRSICACTSGGGGSRDNSTRVAAVPAAMPLTGAVDSVATFWRQASVSSVNPLPTGWASDPLAREGRGMNGRSSRSMRPVLAVSTDSGR
eukprot:3846660-Prymnesium_polylepis.1